MKHKCLTILARLKQIICNPISRCFVLCLLTSNIAWAKNLSIKVPTRTMDYTRFASTLSGNAKQDLPRMRGILARHIANCYIKSASLANGVQNAQNTLNKGCEIEAYNKANILIFMHYSKSGDTNTQNLEDKKREFWQASSPVILATARKIARRALTLD